MVITNILYKSPFDGKTKCVSEDMEHKRTLKELHDYIAAKERLPANCFRLYLNGKHLTTTDDIRDDVFVTIHLPLVGGKGGFGSMLRAIGAQIEKTTNREACRDLSGRRLRDINEEKRLKEWIAKQAKRKEESERKRREKLERMTREPKCEFNDPDYHRIRSDLSESIDTAVQYGLLQSTSSGVSSSSTSSGGNKASGSGVKRKLEDSCSVGESSVKSKKQHSMWLGIDDDIDDDEDSSKDANEEKCVSGKQEEEEEIERDSNSVANNDSDSRVSSSQKMPSN